MRLIVLFYFLLFCSFLKAQMVTNGDFINGANGWMNQCPCNSSGNCIELNPETVYGGTDPSNIVAEIDGHNNRGTTADDRILCQEISCFTIGFEYRLSFLAARRSSSGAPDPISIQVEIDGGVLSEEIIRTGPFDFIMETFTFTATQNSHLLTFRPNFAGSLGMLVDKIQIETLISIEQADTLCENDQHYMLQANPSNGIWTGPGVDASGIFNSSVAGPGSHLVQYSLTSNSGCPPNQVSLTIEVEQSTKAEITPVASICENESSITLSATPMEGQWSGAITDSIFDPELLGVGFHQVVYKPIDFCSTSDTLDIEVLALPDPEIKDPGIICQEDGIITLNADPEGGLWGGVADSNGSINVEDLAVGQHLVSYVFTNDDNCTKEIEIEIEVLALPNPVIEDPGVICQGIGNVNLMAQPLGGTWSGVANADGVVNIDILSVGFHVITYEVINSEGCGKKIDLEIEVVEAPNPIIEEPGIICQGDDFQILSAQPSGGVWGGVADLAGRLDPSNLSVGVHQVTYQITDQNRCTAIAQIDIEVFPSPQLYIEPVSPICENELPIALSYSPSGGTWSSGVDENGIINPGTLGAGVFEAIYNYTDENGCTASATLDFEILSIPEIEIFSPTDICENSDPFTLSATPIGGTWSGAADENGTISSSVLLAGTHQVFYTIETADGCMSSDNLSLEIHETPVIEIQIKENYCLSDLPQILMVEPPGGIWSGDINPDGTFDPSILGTGEFMASYFYSSEKCEVTEHVMFSIVSPDPIVFGENVFCQNTGIVNLEVTPKGGVWSGAIITSNGQINTDGLLAGEYDVSYTVTEDFGPTTSCQRNNDLIIRIIEDVSAGANPVSLKFCNDGSVINLFEELDGANSGGVWTDQSQNPASDFNNGFLNTDNLSPGLYHFEYLVTGFPPCNDATQEIVVEIENPVNAGNVLTKTSLCEGEDLAIDLFELIENYDQGGNWIGLSPISNNGLVGSFFSTKDMPSGSYFFEYLINTQGICEVDKVEVEVLIHPNPIADAGPTQELNCDIRELTLGGATSSFGSDIVYSWSTNVDSSNVLNPTIFEDGIYTLTVTDTLTSCFSTDEVQIIDNGTPPILVAQAFDISCWGASDGAIIAANVEGGTPPFLYSFNDGPFLSNNEFENLSAGEYTVELEDANGCKDLLDFEIEEPAKFISSIETDLQGIGTEIFYGDSVQLFAIINSSFESLIWSPVDLFEDCNSQNNGCFDPWIFPTSDITIQLIAINEQGCSDTSYYTIDVIKDFKIYIPNVFTPNGDHVNDSFQIYSDSGVEKVLFLQIFDRWGELMFEQLNFQPNESRGSWDGSFKRMALDPGVYVYHASIEFKDGSIQVFKGDVTIIK